MVNCLWACQAHIEAHEPIIPALRVLRQEDCEVRPELHNKILSKKTKTKVCKNWIEMKEGLKLDSLGVGLLPKACQLSRPMFRLGKSIGDWLDR